MNRVEILIASLKPGYRDEDLDAVIRWNTEHHRSRGVTDVHYYVSKERRSFVMIVSCERQLSERLAKEWEASGAEKQEWFRSMMSKVFESGGSGFYQEIGSRFSDDKD